MSQEDIDKLDNNLVINDDDDDKDDNIDNNDSIDSNDNINNNDINDNINNNDINDINDIKNKEESNDPQTSLGNTKVKEESVTKDEDEEEDKEEIGKKEMNTLLSNFNSYWIEIFAALGLFLYIIVYEFIGLLTITSLFSFFQNLSIEVVGDLFIFLTNNIGLKWFILVTIFQHLSVGFFCLTTFTAIFKEAENIKKFLIWNVIKIVVFYSLSVGILRGIIFGYVQNFIKKNIEEKSELFSEEEKEKLIEMLTRLVNSTINIVGNFLATYNVFLDKFVLGLLYICLFKTPYNISGKTKIAFRALSFFPIAFIISSLVLRSLVNIKYLELNEFVTPIFLASKVTVYFFFIITLIVIKIKSIKYNVYDKENSISPKVFKKIAFKTFTALGVIELIIGFAKSDWSNYGLGGKYLLILCSAIIAFYDYKKESKLTLPCSKSKDCSTCFKVVFNIIGYSLIIVLGGFLLLFLISFVELYIRPLIDLVKENLDIILIIISKAT